MHLKEDKMKEILQNHGIYFVDNLEVANWADGLADIFREELELTKKREPYATRYFDRTEVVIRELENFASEVEDGL